ncbi:Lsr2 family DNA-binding protein [Cellulomonas sp. Y8]|uniref:Lsr2 family DNA-binding protein n=1 Tax=Cellulomonas sp. Y8 TaxID=2591145 RepID=UPI003D735FB1
MTDLTALPTDRATCGWLPLPAGPPPSPPPDRADHRPPDPPLDPSASPPEGTRADPQSDDPGLPEPAAVQAALDTLTRWLRSGGTVVCGSGGPDAADHAVDAVDGADADRPDGAGMPPDPVPPAAPGDAPAAGAQAAPGADPGTDPAADPATGPAADPTTPSGPAERGCRHCRRVVDPVRVRAWARERGLRVADRGRLPAAIVAAYLATHPHV